MESKVMASLFKKLGEAFDAESQGTGNPPPNPAPNPPATGNGSNETEPNTGGQPAPQNPPPTAPTPPNTTSGVGQQPTAQPPITPGSMGLQLDDLENMSLDDVDKNWDAIMDLMKANAPK